MTFSMILWCSELNIYVPFNDSTCSVCVGYYEEVKFFLIIFGHIGRYLG